MGILARGYFNTNGDSIYGVPDGKKSLVKFFRAVNRHIEDTYQTVNVFVSSRGQQRKIIPVDFQFEKYHMIEIIQPGEELSLNAGEYIGVICQHNNSIDFVISGEESDA